MHILDKNAIVERLRNFREVREISARQFAVDADIDQSHYSKVENGKMPVTEKMLIKFFSKYADMDRDYILYGRINTAFQDGMTAAGQRLPGQYHTTNVNTENNVVDVVNSLMSLAPPVNPALTPLQQVYHYKDRESKLLMAIDLLKAAIGNLQNEADQLRQKVNSREHESY